MYSALAAAIAAALPQLAIAAPTASFAAAPQTTPHQLPVITVTGTELAPSTANIGPLFDEPLTDIPQTVTVASQQLMQQQGATNLEQALGYVPGITFAAAEGGAIGDNINLRGFSAQTDIYLDGFRDRGQYYRDVFSLDAIDVLKGPSSMLFGRGSTGGIVNQVSKVPSWTPHDVIQASAGTSNQYRVTGDFDHAINDEVAYRIPVMLQSIHSTRDVMHNRDYGVAPSLRIRPNSRTQITFSSLLEHNHDMPDYGIPALGDRPAPVSRDNFYGLTSDHTTQDVAMGSVDVRYQAAPNLTLRNRLSYAHYRIDAIESAGGNVGFCSTPACTDYTKLPADVDPDAYPLDDLYAKLSAADARVIHDTSAYDQFSGTWQFATGPLRHKLVFGGDLGRETYRNNQLTVNGNVFFPLLDPQHVSAAEAGVTYGPTRNYAHATATSYAGYVNDIVSVGRYWKVVGGVRWDHYHAHLTDTNDTRGPADASQTVRRTSVRSGILYQPTAAQTYYVSYGTSFDPALETLSVPHQETDSNLPAPAHSKSLEAGAKYLLFDGALALDASVFHVRQDNVSVPIGAGVYQPEGSVRIHGGEVDFTGHLTTNWEVFGGYTRLNGRIADPIAANGDAGNVPADTPRNNATLWTNYAFGPRWSAGAGAVWQSRRYVNTTDTVAVPAFVRFDATVAYNRLQYNIRLNLFNLTNKRYFSGVIQSDGGRSIPGPSRTAMLTVTWRID